jgi:ataxin-10
VVLNHCNVDSRNPYLREWSLLAVRSLCADNLENQACIEALKPQETVATATLRSMGIEAKLEAGDDGRPRVRVQRTHEGGQGSRETGDSEGCARKE